MKNQLQPNRYSLLNSEKRNQFSNLSILPAQNSGKKSQMMPKKPLHPHIQFITLNKQTKTNADKLNFNNTRQTQMQMQCLSHRSSSRLMENMIDGSGIKQVYIAQKQSKSYFLTENQNVTQNNYDMSTLPDDLNNYHNRPILDKDFGHIDNLIRGSLQQQKQEQLMHQRVSNLSSQHQYEPEQLALQANNKTNISINNLQNIKPLTNPSIQQVQQSHANLDAQEDLQNQQDFLQMVIQLDSETSIPLRIHSYDDPLLLSRQFCYSNNIDPKVITILAKQIKQLQYKSLSNNQSNNSHNNSVSKYNKNQNSQTIMHEKQNRQLLSNTNHTKQKKRNNSRVGDNFYQKNQQQIQPFDIKTKNNTLNNTLNKNNNKNNTTLISNTQNNYTQLYIPNIHDDNPSNNVFNRLYRNSQAKAKKQVLQRNKEKSLQSQQQLRNYESSVHSINNSQHVNTSIENMKQPNLNQSTTYINNLSNSNINSMANLHYSRSRANHQSSNKNFFVQAKIYEKNVKLQKQTQKKNQHIKQELKNMEEKQYTRHPVINPLSKLIVSKLRQIDYEPNQQYGEQKQNINLKNSHIRLFQQKSKSKQKKIAKTIDHLKKKQQQQMKQCTFHPKILKKSKCQVVNTERFLLLHQDFYVRQNKAQTVKAAESKKIFQRRHPQINEVSKRLMKDKSFGQRMTQYKINAERNKEKIQRQIYSVEKYRPQINKKSKNHKRQNVSIGQYLYSKSLEKKSKNIQSQKDLKKGTTNKLSQNMYNQMKKNAFRYIFTLMDSDQDGLISALKINILGLETELLHLLAPLLCQMQEVQIELDEQQFVQSLQRLFNTFTVYQKNLILNVYKNPLRKQSKCKNQSSFHPSLNQKSIQLAREVRENGVSLYELGKQKQMQKQAKLNQLRALKALIQIQQCTFHPNLIYHH